VCVCVYYYIGLQKLGFRLRSIQKVKSSIASLADAKRRSKWQECDPRAHGTATHMTYFHSTAFVSILFSKVSLFVKCIEYSHWTCFQEDRFLLITLFLNITLYIFNPLHGCCPCLCSVLHLWRWFKKLRMIPHRWRGLSFTIKRHLTPSPVSSTKMCRKCTELPLATVVC
jgi:hypothetical protein